MEKKADLINFSINRIETKQFAILEEFFIEDKSINLVTAVTFGSNKDLEIVGVWCTFKFEIEDKPFLLVEVACDFKINTDAWKSFLQEDHSGIIFPKGLMTHLTTLVVGTTRGVLHTKTENSKFNHFIIPPINVTELVTDDVVVKFEQ